MLPISDEVWKVGRKLFAAKVTVPSRTPNLSAKKKSPMFGSRRPSSARFADKPEDFAKLGIRPERIEVFEDGMRTEGGPGGYE